MNDYPDFVEWAEYMQYPEWLANFEPAPERPHEYLVQKENDE